MKITALGNSPPTIQQATQVGLSPEKLQRIKAIATGEDNDIQESEVPEPQPQKPEIPTIKLKTDVSHTKPISPNDQNFPKDEIDTKSAISDASVQVNEAAEATAALDPQVARLAKARRALQLKEQEIAQREAALKEATATKAELEAKIKAQPLSVLQEYGVTYDQLTEAILAGQGQAPSPEIQALKAEIKALKEGVDKTLSDKDAATEQATLKEIRKNVGQIAQQGDQFELIRETKSEADVVDLIHRTYKESGELLSELEAMKLIEAELEKDAIRIANLKKVQSKIKPAEAPLQQQPIQKGMKTLTNKDSAKPVLDRRQRAMLAAQGLLKG